MKRPLRLLVATAAAVPATPGRRVPHVVAPGETLWGLAAAQNVTTRAFAAANGLPEDLRLVAGTSLRHPTTDEAAGALGAIPAASPRPPRPRPGWIRSEAAAPCVPGSLAAAGYFQGPASVTRIGMLPETRRYVDNVQVLRSRFGG